MPEIPLPTFSGPFYQLPLEKAELIYFLTPLSQSCLVWTRCSLTDAEELYLPVATICSWFPPPRGLCPPAHPGEAMGRGVHIHQSLCFSDGQVNVPVSRYLVPPRDKLPAGGVLQSSPLTYQGCWVCCRKPLQNDKSWEVTGGCQPTSKYMRWPLPG